MARNWIVVGDPTSSGGSVITGSSFTDIDGIPVVRVNSRACPACSRRPITETTHRPWHCSNRY